MKLIEQNPILHSAFVLEFYLQLKAISPPYVTRFHSTKELILIKMKTAKETAFSFRIPDLI